MAVGDVIDADDYNNVFNLINPIIGTTTGFGTGGYGRTLLSSAVSVGDTVTSTDVINLFLDLQSGFVHQTGAISTAVNVQSLDPGDTIFWTDWGSSTDVTGLYDIAKAINDFDAANTDPAAASFDSVTTTGTRTTAWNSTISHSVTYTWTSAAEQDYWWNSGGQLRFNGSLTGGNTGTAGSKDDDWEQLLSGIGTISIKRVDTDFVTGSSNSVGTGSTFTEAQMETAGGQTVYTKFGGDAANVYSDNRLRITGFKTATEFTIVVYFDDLDAGTGNPADGVGSTPIDEDVTGDLTSNIIERTANSTFQVTYTGDASPTTVNAIVSEVPTATVNTNMA